MVGDSIASDITGGRAAGMFTIWIDPAQESPPPSCVDLRVRDLNELHQLWRVARRRLIEPAARQLRYIWISASCDSSSSPTRAGFALPPVCFIT